MTDTALPAPKPATHSAGSLVLLALLTLFWGINWPIMKVALNEVPVFTFRTFCLGGGAMGLFAIAWAKGMPMRLPWRFVPRMAMIALFNITMWNVLVLYGLAMLPAGRAVILAFTMPLWVIPLSVAMLGERFTGAKLVGLAVGLAGLAVLIGGDWQAMAAKPLGALLVLGAAVSWAIGTIAIKRYPVPLPSVTFVGWQMILGGLPIFLAAPLLESHLWKPYSAEAWAAAIYNAVVCFVFCYWAWNRLVQVLPAGISGLSTLMIPVVGVFSSMLMLGEQPGWPEFAALALVSAALLIILRPAKG